MAKAPKKPARKPSEAVLILRMDPTDRGLKGRMTVHGCGEAERILDEMAEALGEQFPLTAPKPKRGAQ